MIYPSTASKANSDPNVQLYLETKAKFYRPGEYVEGEIYLTIISDRPYHKLALTLNGEEEVFLGLAK